MSRDARLFLMLGAGNGGLAVILGAFGAHGLEARLTPELLDTYETAASYHFYHALGLLAVGWVVSQLPGSGAARWAGRLMMLGILLFCGALYTLAVSGQTWLGAVAPLGGSSFVAGWAALLLALVKDGRPHPSG